MSDHSQNPIPEAINLAAAVTGPRALLPSDPDPDEAEVALCPGARSAQVYVLDEDASRRPRARGSRAARGGRGRRPGDRAATAEGGLVSSERGSLRFRTGGDLTDTRGGSWTVTGDHAALDLSVTDGVVRSGDYPHALGRLWSALDCERTGEVLVSAEPDYEFVDWGGQLPSRRRQPRIAASLRLSRRDAHLRDRHARARAVVDRGRHPARARPLRRGGVRPAGPQAPPAPDERVHTRVREGVRRRHNWVQLVKFCAVGGSGYVVNLAVFTLGVAVLDLHHLVAATLAFVVAVTNNFWWNRHWTFGAGDGHAGFQAARFFTVSVGAFLFAAAILEALVNGADVAEIPAQAISIVAATPLNFIGNKMWSFGRRPDD